MDPHVFRSFKMELTTMNISTATPKYNGLKGSGLRGLKLAALVLGTSVLLAGCAGKPPSEQYAVTQSAVNAAVTAGATEYAPVEMKSAQDKFKQSELSMQEKKYDDARKYAEQAEWDARVAERKAQAAKAQKAVQDARQGVNELREEGMRQAQPVSQ
jgi:hypothetical protein